MITVAAWRVHRAIDGDLSQLNFNTVVVKGLLLSEIVSETADTGHSESVSAQVRFDGVNHFLGAQGRPKRCEVCSKNSARLERKKCGVRLFNDCSITYHSNKQRLGVGLKIRKLFFEN